MKRISLIFTLLVSLSSFGQTYLGFGIPPSEYHKSLDDNYDFVLSDTFPKELFLGEYEVKLSKDNLLEINSLKHPLEGFYGTLVYLYDKVYKLEAPHENTPYNLVMMDEMNIFYMDDYTSEWKWIFVNPVPSNK